MNRIDALVPKVQQVREVGGGNIHHVNNAVSFTDRVPYSTGVPGVYAGAGGYNAAQRILTDLQIRASRQ